MPSRATACDKVYEIAELPYGYPEANRLGSHDPYSANLVFSVLSFQAVFFGICWLGFFNPLLFES
jgi:hypothetical protein